MKKIFFEELNSTNLWIKSNWQNLEDKTVVYTFKQTAGLGQFDRKWLNLDSENLFFSICLKPKLLSAEILSELTLYACCCVCDLLQNLNLLPKIKKPNDVLINDKKIAGILAQSIFKGEELKMFCLGIGINVNAQKNLLVQVSQPATAINLEQDKMYFPQEILDEFLNLFFNDYDKFLNKGFESIKDKYLFYQK